MGGLAGAPPRFQDERISIRSKITAPTPGRAPRRALAGAMLCNTLEWYDFAIYGILAAYISRAFFPGEDPDTALLATFALFGVSFVLRPLGALVIGRFGDRRGRKPALLLTIAMMAAGTLMIGLIPTHGSIGILAPVLLLIARLVQGFSAGGEWGVANAFLIEWAPEGQRGLWTSFMAMTLAIGSFLANGLTALIITLMPPDDMASWGWRIPFLVGGALGVVGLWLRSRLEETPAYRNATRVNARSSEPSLKANLKQGLLVFGLTVHWSVCYYVFFIYMPTFTKAQAHLTSAQSIWSNTIGLMAVIALVPVIGSLSDRHGRKPFLLASCAAVILLAAPAFWLIATAQNFVITVAIQIAFGCANALYSGPGPAVTAELFSTRDRSRWSGLFYALAAAVFGGFAPLVAAWLVRETGSPLAPTAYVIAAAMVSFLVVLRIRETAHRPLE